MKSIIFSLILLGSLQVFAEATITEVVEANLDSNGVGTFKCTLQNTQTDSLLEIKRQDKLTGFPDKSGYLFTVSDATNVAMGDVRFKVSGAMSGCTEAECGGIAYYAWTKMANEKYGFIKFYEMNNSARRIYFTYDAVTLKLKAIMYPTIDVCFFNP